VTRVKICGLCRAEDVVLSLELGVDALGFNREKNSPRYLESRVASELAAMAGPYCVTVAIYGRFDPKAHDVKMTAIQAVGLCGPHLPPCQTLINAHRIRETDDVAKILAGLDTGVDALLLDAFVEGVFGGTGKRVNWDLAAEVVANCAKPVILAGGLTPDNVGDAVRRVKPYAVDVSSGIESEARLKDPGKLRAFVQAARSA
jgi:phosphoribosylanthranilate isomerase